MITYTAWLKANYRPEFMAAYLSSQIGSKKEDLAAYVRDVRNSGIKVLPPDVNTSHGSFTPVGEVIRFGLGAVSKCGQAALDAILSARKTGGPFESLWDFLCRADLRVVNKSVVENLIKAGAFDSLNENRRQLAEGLPELISTASRKCMDESQQSLFDLTEDVCGGGGPSLPQVEDYSLRERLEGEKEATGLYISGHPFEQHDAKVRSYSNCSISDLKLWKGRKNPLLVGGMILSVKERTTKNGDPMGTIELEDGEARVEAVCFPDLGPSQGRLSPGRLCFVSGFPRNGLSPASSQRFIALRRRQPARRLIKIFRQCRPMEKISVKELFRALKAFPGKSPVLFEIKDGGDSVTMLLQDVKVDAAAPISEAVEEILPVGAFSIG